MSNPKAPPAEWMLEAAKELGRMRRHITGYQPVEEVARVIARFAPAPEEREPDSSSVMQDDMAELLRVLGLGDHARPYSAHEVMVSEIIPAVRKLAPAPASPTVADHEFKPHATEAYPDGCLRVGECHEWTPDGLCGLHRSAHPVAAPEPPALVPWIRLWHDFKPCNRGACKLCHYEYSSEATCDQPEAAHAPAPSVQHAACPECGWPEVNHDWACKHSAYKKAGKVASEPAAQDRLGEIAERLMYQCKTGSEVRAELVKLIYGTTTIARNLGGVDAERAILEWAGLS